MRTTPQRKKKEFRQPLLKKDMMQVVSHEAMTAAQASLFEKAVDGLLAELIRSLDRRNKGEAHGSTEE